MKMSRGETQRCLGLLAVLLALTGGLSWAQEPVARLGPNEAHFHAFEGLMPVFPTPMAEPPFNGPSYTYPQQTGNRLISGHADLPAARVVDIALLDRPQWIVGFPVGDSSVWVVVLTDGQIQTFLLTGDVVETLASPLQPYSMPTPPALVLIDDSVQLLIPPSPSGSLFTHPIQLNSPDLALASLDQGGNLGVWEQERVTHLLLDALPDGRLLSDEAGRILVLTNPSTRYAHGILGDTLEATGITLLETTPCIQVLADISVPAPYVIEGLSPIWADLDGDGSREILVTVSDAAEGARLLVYTETGELLGTSPSIGRGYRWRHQLAVAPFGPNGETEIATVLTPHIGGVVEFYRLLDDQLVLTARVPGYSTHVMRSRNLDMALAGDFDADGSIELLVPNQQFDTLGAIRRSADGAQLAWTVPVGGRLSTNMAAVQFADDSIVLGVGHSGKVLRLWIP
jgi:hypothetical protein